MKRQSVKQLRGGIRAAIYLLDVSNQSAARSVLAGLVQKNGGKEKVHRKAHTRKQNGKLVHVRAS